MEERAFWADGPAQAKAWWGLGTFAEMSAVWLGRPERGGREVGRGPLLEVSEPPQGEAPRCEQWGLCGPLQCDMTAEGRMDLRGLGW